MASERNINLTKQLLQEAGWMQPDTADSPPPMEPPASTQQESASVERVATRLADAIGDVIRSVVSEVAGGAAEGGEGFGSRSLVPAGPDDGDEEEEPPLSAAREAPALEEVNDSARGFAEALIEAIQAIASSDTLGFHPPEATSPPEPEEGESFFARARRRVKELMFGPDDADEDDSDDFAADAPPDDDLTPRDRVHEREAGKAYARKFRLWMRGLGPHPDEERRARARVDDDMGIPEEPDEDEPEAFDAKPDMPKPEEVVRPGGRRSAPWVDDIMDDFEDDPGHGMFELGDMYGSGRHAQDQTDEGLASRRLHEEALEYQDSQERHGQELQRTILASLQQLMIDNNHDFQHAQQMYQGFMHSRTTMTDTNVT